MIQARCRIKTPLSGWKFSDWFVDTFEEYPVSEFAEALKVGHLSVLSIQQEGKELEVIRGHHFPDIPDNPHEETILTFDTVQEAVGYYESLYCILGT